MISVDTYRLLGPFNINLGDFASYALFFPLNVLMMSLFVVFVSILHFWVRLYSVYLFVIYLHHHLKSSNPLWSESLSLSVSAVIGWELGTRQTSLSSFSGTFFISFFFAALFNNVSSCGYYTSLCVPLSSRWVFLCHFGVIPYLWWFYWVILSLGLFWRDILVLMNIFDWVLSSFRFYHYSAVRVSLYAVAKSLSLY